MKSGFSIAAFGALLIAAPAAHADQHVAFEQLPQAVQAAVTRLTQGAQIQDIEVNNERGVAEYEVEYLRDAVEWEINLAEDGTVLRHEQD